MDGQDGAGESVTVVHETPQQRESLALVLPTYVESISTAAGGGNHPGGFSNPRYVFEGRGVTVGGEEEREGGEPEDSDDDLPPPYSPGLAGQQAVFVAPPEYFAIFGQIREAREESTNHFIFLQKLCQILLNTVGCTVLLLVFMSVPIAILALGSHYIDDCPAEPNIPIFLVVGGMSGAIKNIVLVFENIVKRTSHRFSVESSRRLRYIKFTWRGVNFIFNLFLIAWIIAGSYWIYHIYRQVDPAYKNCHETLYKLAFGVITSSYILFTLMCCCVCFCGLCLIPRQSREPGDDDGDGGGASGEEGGDERAREGEAGEGEEEEREGEETRQGPDSPAIGMVISDTNHRHSGPCGHDGTGGPCGCISHDGTSGHNGPSSHGGHDGTSSHGGPSGHDGTSGIGHVTTTTQPPPAPLSLDIVQDVVTYEYTPILNPRSRQLTPNEQEPPLSIRTTSV